MIQNCDGDNGGIFDFVSNQENREMIQTAYEAVQELGLMEWIGSVDPKDGGFMFFNHPNISKIYARIDKVYSRHSGASFVLTMRTIQFIARNGLEAFKVATLADE